VGTGLNGKSLSKGITQFQDGRYKTGFVNEITSSDYKNGVKMVFPHFIKCRKTA